jgi:hypothetical protein
MYKGFTRSSAQSSIRSSTRSSMYKGFTQSSTYRGSTRGSARSSTYGGFTRNSASGPRYIPDTAMFTTSFHQICCAHLISLRSPPTIYSNYSEQRPRRTTKGVRYDYYVQLVQLCARPASTPKISNSLRASDFAWLPPIVDGNVTATPTSQPPDRATQNYTKISSLYILITLPPLNK